MSAAYVTGIGLFTPGYPSPRSWCEGRPDEEADKPEAKMLAGPLRRRATALTRIGIDVLEQAAAMGGADLSTVPSVWATAHGEHSAAIALLGLMQKGEGKLSPTKFHNSVHNTASGYASIASTNCSPSTTLTGGHELAASALFEAMCLLGARGGEVALVLADEALMPPFERKDALAPLGLSLLLSDRPAGALARLHGLRAGKLDPARPADVFEGLHVAAALPLIEAIVAGDIGTIALSAEADEDGQVWCVELESPVED